MENIAKRLLRQPEPKEYKRFEKYEEIPADVVVERKMYHKMIFMSEEQEEEWNNLPENVRKQYLALLRYSSMQVTLEYLRKTRLKHIEENNCKYGSAPI